MTFRRAWGVSGDNCGDGMEMLWNVCVDVDVEVQQWGQQLVVSLPVSAIIIDQVLTYPCL